MESNSKQLLSDVAYEALKERIISLPGGSHISIRQFAGEVDMSYTPVREAFLRMEQEGILKWVANVGFFVETIDITEIIQFFQVRECLEVFVLEQVFEQIEEHHIDEMKTINAKQYEALSKGNIKEYQSLDLQFHEVIFRIYGNKLLLEFYRTIRERYMIVSSKIGKWLSDEAFIEHTEYFNGLETGNKEKAIKELSQHINKNMERMKEGYINLIMGNRQSVTIK